VYAKFQIVLCPALRAWFLFFMTSASSGPLVFALRVKSKTGPSVLISFQCNALTYDFQTTETTPGVQKKFMSGSMLLRLSYVTQLMYLPSPLAVSSPTLFSEWSSSLFSAETSVSGETEPAVFTKDSSLSYTRRFSDGLPSLFEESPSPSASATLFSERSPALFSAESSFQESSPRPP
jgi:hypothetical protein